MRSFKSIFNDVYGKGLMKYGFQKVKGLQPYYARCVGDEIVHVITYREEYNSDPSAKDFVIFFGVATVYRKKIMFDEPTKYSNSWLSELSTICYKENYYPAHDRRAYEEMIPRWFTFVKADEKSMMDAIKKSFELTEKYAIPILEKVTTLEDCMNHLFKYRASLLWVYEASDAYVQRDIGYPHNEGLLSTVIYGQDRFEEYEKAKLRVYEESNDDTLYCINAGIWRLTMEQYRNEVMEKKELLKEQLNQFKELLKPEWQEKIRRELELRKKNNTAILREAGFEI